MRTVLRGIVLVAVTAGVYWPSVGFDFIWDDNFWVTEDPLLADAKGLWATWTGAGRQHQYSPVVSTSFWIERRLWGTQDASGYHATNIALHAINALLLWRLLVHLRVPGAWVASAIFALHPVHVESVSWVSERKNLLAGLFALAATRAYVGFAGMPECGARNAKCGPPVGSEVAHGWHGSRPGGGGVRYALSFLLFALALLSKSAVVMLPVVLGLLVWWKCGRLGTRHVASLAPFLGVSAAMAAVAIWFERHVAGAAGETFSLAPLERGVLAGRIVWFYVGKLLWPLDLQAVYPRWTIDPGRAASCGPSVLLAASVIAVWVSRPRIGRGLCVSLAGFLANLLPVAGLVWIHYMRYSYVADHFVYVPAMAFIPGVVGTGTWALGRLRRFGLQGVGAPLAQTAVACAVLCWTAGATYRHQALYRDSQTLWRRTADRDPTCWLADFNIGEILREQGKGEEAIPYYHAGLRVRPDLPVHWSNLGVLYAKLGRTDEAIQSYRRALEVDPKNVQAWVNWGILQVRQGDLDGALAKYRAALDVAPEQTHVWSRAGNVLAAQGRLAEAILYLSEALRRDPRADDTRVRLGLICHELGRTDEAIRTLEEGLELDPDASVYRALAWVLATCAERERRDGRRAVDLARKAVQREGRETVQGLDTLAAAQAQAGQFAEAALIAGRALDMATEQGNPEQAAVLKERIRLYEMGMTLGTTTRPAAP